MGRSAICFSCGAVVAVLISGSGCVVQSVDHRRSDCTEAQPDEVGVCRHPDRSFADPECCALRAARQCDVVGLSLAGAAEPLSGRLASLYAIDEQGEPAFDEAATRVAIKITGGGSQAAIGTERFGTDGGDAIEQLEEPSVHEELTAYETYRLAHETSVDSFTLRVFAAYDVGVLLHSHPSYEHGSRRVATVDCRGVVRTARAPEIAPAEVSCAIVWLNPPSGQVGDGLAHVYEVSSDGRLLADPQATHVHIRQTSAGWAIELGHQHYSEQQGDAVTASDDAADPGTWSYRVRAAHWAAGQALDVRIFSHSGFGVLEWSAAATDSAGERFAVLDCRGVPAPNGG